MRKDELIVYRNCASRNLFSRMSRVMDHDLDRDDDAHIVQEVYECIAMLLDRAGRNGFYGNLWHCYLANILVNDENSYSRACEMRGGIQGTINEAVLHDIQIFKEYFDYDFTELTERLHIDALLYVLDYKPSGEGSKIYNTRIRDRICDLAQRFEQSDNAEQMKDLLTQFYAEYGVGKFGLHKAFRVTHDSSGVYIDPILNIRHVYFRDLVGYERAKQKLIENTEAFVEGRPCNNVLLYGEAGTGKSSSIKAVANEFYSRGLRVIEIYRYQFQDLNDVISQIKNRGYKFILYMDDLSFEEFETEYKYLKAVIEGGLEKRPSNVLIYATSNRRHLIRESFSDRDGAEIGDKHHGDTVQEKLSLANRFGVSIYYGAPTFEEYQEIVLSLARRNGIAMDQEQLRKEATRWEMTNGGLSGRTAQQFINYLLGTELADAAAVSGQAAENGGKGRSMTIHTFGAIDVGSYEQELKIFEVSKARGIRPVDSLVRRVDLGSDTYQTGKIRSGNVREVGDILREFREVMNNYRVTEYKAYGTSAIREMDNASMVLSLWEQRSGIHVGVLSNSEQRFLDYKSAAAKIGDFDSIISDSCAIVDIGGGSIQISLFSDGKLGATQNLRLGILRLYEQIRTIDAREFQRDAMIREMVDSQLEVFQKLYLNNRKVRNLIIVDDYISALMQSRKMEDVSAGEFTEYVGMARDMSVPEIARRVQMADDNVPLLYISGVLMECIIEAFGTEHIWAPGITLCDGIAYEFAEKQKILPPSHNFDEDIIACAHNISRRYMGDETRGETIETIALRIFDALRKQYGLSKRERLLLRICAILHDCGKYISITNLAECSYNIIMSTEIIGLSHIEREVVANVVRFNHSEFVYYEEQQNMSDLDLDAYLMIGRLTAILRLANGMDRSHKRKFEDFGLTLKPDRLQINIRPGVDITLEKGMFAHRADFFEEIFGIRPVIRQKK